MANGYSLHIGLPRVSPDLPEAAEPLAGAENDANEMETIAQQQGFQAKKMIAEEATADNILTYIREKTAILQPGDIFLVTFSGHGREGNGLRSKKANAWLAYDRMVDRTELHSVFGLFKKGVRIVGISDCCFSQNILPPLLKQIRFLQEEVGLSVVNKLVPATALDVRSNSTKKNSTTKPGDNRKLHATAIIFSSSRANALSIFLTKHGLFTQKLLAVWDNGAFAGSYHDFFLAIRYAMIRIQAPTYEVRGPRDPKFEKERPFTI
ncbi:MAG TPA: caspase family protein [Candidatus Angelobacter sp.]|nr:caspase family protein [Candidatus Angelobacter sp.]